MRPRPWLAVLVVVALARAVAVTTAPVADASCAAWKARTADAMLAFRSRFAAPNGAFYAYATAAGSTGSADYWYTPHALHVLLASVELGLADGPPTVSFIELFLAFHDREGWVTPYIDDQMWMIEELVNAVALVQRYDVDLALRVRNKAVELGNNIYSAWDTSCCGAHPGGVWWDYGHTYKATASNAGCAIALMALYQLTGEAKWLTRARLVYTYWTGEQVEPSGQVLDGITSSGVKDRRLFTYNEGMYVMASTALWQATHEVSFLESAENPLAFLVRNETSAAGVLREMATDNIPLSNFDWQEFKGITFRYLGRYLGEIKPLGVFGASVARVDALLRTSVLALRNHTSAQHVFPYANWETDAQGGTIPLASQTAGMVTYLSWTRLVCNGVVSDGSGATTAVPSTTTLAPTTTVPLTTSVASTTTQWTTVRRPTTTLFSTTTLAPTATVPLTTSIASTTTLFSTTTVPTTTTLFSTTTVPSTTTRWSTTTFPHTSATTAESQVVAVSTSTTAAPATITTVVLIAGSAAGARDSASHTRRQASTVRPTGHYTTPSILAPQPFDLTPLLFAIGVTTVVAVCGLVVFCLVRGYRRRVRRREGDVPADALQAEDALALDGDDMTLYVDTDDEFLDDL